MILPLLAQGLSLRISPIVLVARLRRVLNGCLVCQRWLLLTRSWSTISKPLLTFTLIFTFTLLGFLELPLEVFNALAFRSGPCGVVCGRSLPSLTCLILTKELAIQPRIVR